MFRTLAEEGINIQMISTSEIKISVVVDEKYLELAVRVLHKAFELDQQPASGEPGNPGHAPGFSFVAPPLGGETLSPYGTCSHGSTKHLPTVRAELVEALDPKLAFRQAQRERAQSEFP
jgi:hypothetical protein